MDGGVLLSAQVKNPCLVQGRSRQRRHIQAGSKGLKQVGDFKIGDTVKITGATMTGNVGTVVSLDEKRQKYLVRITEETQNYFPANDLELFKP